MVRRLCKSWSAANWIASGACSTILSRASQADGADMKTNDIEFNADDLVGSVEAFAQHLTGKQKLTLRTATMPLPPPVKSLTPSYVRAIARNSRSASQVTPR